ncbi:MAG: T9SS type A sorting domain-containing protein, partial [Flavobacteriales bacterium]
FIVSTSNPSATYQWQTDLGVGFQNLNVGGQYSGTTNDTLTVSNATMNNNNQPFRCVVSSGACTDTSTIAVLTVNNNVGLNEKSQQLSVYPNPAQSMIYVNADHNLSGLRYTIYDRIGKIALTGTLNAQTSSIDLAHLSDGTYIFSVGEYMDQTFTILKK